MKHWDWLVIGSRPSAWMASLLAVQMGYRVYHLETEESGTDAEGSWIPGLESTLLRKLFTKGLPVNQPNSVTQLLTPSLRVALGPAGFDEADPDLRILEDWIRECGTYGTQFWLSQWAESLPQEAEKWKQFQKIRMKLAARPFGNQSKRQVLSQCRFEKSLLTQRSLLDLPKRRPEWWNSVALPLLQSLGTRIETLPSHWAPRKVAVHLASMASFHHDRRIWADSIQSPSQWLKREAIRAGVTIGTTQDLTAVFRNQGNWKWLTNSANALGGTATSVIIGTSWNQFLKWNPKSQARRLPTGWFFSLQWMAHEESVPAHFPERSFWKDASTGVEIEVVKRFHNAQGGQVSFSARTLLPWTEESISSRYIKMTAGRLFHLISEIFPFMEFHVWDISPDFREYGFESPWSSLDQIPEELKVYDSKSDRLFLGAQGRFAGPDLGTGVDRNFPMIATLDALTDRMINDVDWPRIQKWRAWLQGAPS